MIDEMSEKVVWWMRLVHEESWEARTESPVQYSL